MCSFSCKDKASNNIDGTITDMSSGLPVEGVKVSLDYTEINSGTINTAFKPLMETYTDAEGKYSFQFESKSYVKLRLTYAKNEYFTTVNEFSPESLLADYLISDQVPQESYLYVRVVNVHGINSEDVLKIRILGINPDCQNCGDSNYKTYTGVNVDTSFVYSVVGGDNITISTIATHDGETQMSDVDKYCTPGDTVFYTCYY